MAKYRVVKTSLIDGRIVHPGVDSIVEYEGLPGSNLEALDKEGEARKAERAEQLRPKDPNEAIGRGMAEGFVKAQAKKPKDSGADPDDTPTLVSAAGAVTTVGHTSVPQRSAGGVDAENLLEADSKGKSGKK